MITYKFIIEDQDVTVATLDDGDGLFVWGRRFEEPSSSWIQIEGTCQFSVAKLKDPRAKIRRYLKEHNVTDNLRYKVSKY